MLHDEARQLAFDWEAELVSASPAASVTTEAFPLKRKHKSEDEFFDELYPGTPHLWVRKAFLARLDAEAKRQRAMMPKATDACQHCGAVRQFIPDLDGRMCLVCGCVQYRQR